MDDTQLDVYSFRIGDGVVAREAAQAIVADADTAATEDVHYQVLCRRLHRSGHLGPSAGDGTLPLPDY